MSLKQIRPTAPESKKSRKPLRSLHELFGAGNTPSLLWLLNKVTRDSPAEAKISKWHSTHNQGGKNRPMKKKVADTLLKQLMAAISKTNGQPGGVGQTLKCLAAAQEVAVIRQCCDPKQSWPLIETLLSQTDQLHYAADDTAAGRWHEQLLAVELPLTLAYQLPNVVVQQDLAQPAADWLATTLQESLDDDGWPRSDVLPLFGPLMASWARSMRLVRKLKLDFPTDASSQLEWAVRQVLRLLRSDDTLMFSGSDTLPMPSECLKLMLKISADREDHKLAKSAKQKRRSKKSKRKKYSEISSLSEWGESGILQSGWHRSAPKVCFDYSHRSFKIEVGTSQSLIRGVAMPTIKFDGDTVVPIDGFEVVCNEFDSDLDYLELQMPLSQSLTLTRQLILSRDEEFLLIADCVAPLRSGKIEYQCDWPLAAGITVLPETETREVYLQTAKIQALVLPLSLSEWTVGPTSGRLQQVGTALQISDRIEGHGIYVPLVLDLNPTRAKRKRTWRQLTVGEERVPVPRDVAAAFRFQLDKQQWFFYRTVSKAGNRTFLGENFNGEFVISRIDRQGIVDEMIRIEG